MSVDGKWSVGNGLLPALFSPLSVLRSLLPVPPPPLSCGVSKAKPKPAPESLTFEQALEALEEISRKIEAGEVGLEDSIAEYEHGMALIKRCREVLAKAQQRVEELQRKEA